MSATFKYFNKKMHTLRKKEQMWKQRTAGKSGQRSIWVLAELFLQQKE